MNDYSHVDILLVEDNPRDAEMTMRALGKINLANKVYLVKDGEEALEFVFCTDRYTDRPQGHNPKLILLDIKMPKVDGIEVLRRIKSEKTLSALPIVIMTSSNEERDLVESYSLGVNSYIVKPVQFGDFVETVARIGLYWLLTNRTAPDKDRA